MVKVAVMVIDGVVVVGGDAGARAVGLNGDNEVIGNRGDPSRGRIEHQTRGRQGAWRGGRQWTRAG